MALVDFLLAYSWSCFRTIPQRRYFDHLLLVLGLAVGILGGPVIEMTEDY